MNLYMSLGTNTYEGLALFAQDISKLNILVAYPYRSALKERAPHEFANFMADSGAFTAMNTGIKIDRDYIEQYATWVKDNAIANYVELDLDEVVGVEETIKIRKQLEMLVGYPSIPCWHIERGQDGWQRMCDEYDYVSISLSGFTNTSKWLRAHKYQPLKWFMAEARKRRTRVHALGCNQIDLLKRFHFYSCDSSTHTLGVRYGNILRYSNGTIKRVGKDKTYKKDQAKIAENNVLQMIRMMEYAREHM